MERLDRVGHQVPTGEMHENAAHVRILEQWMKSYRPEELFDESGRLHPELADPSASSAITCDVPAMKVWNGPLIA